MAAGILNVKQGWVWALALFIFFFNTFLLPEGLTYTLLLTPVWCYLLYQQDKLKALLVVSLPLAIYTVIHVTLGVDIGYYFTSLLLMISVVIFIATTVVYINSPNINLDIIFRDIAVLNFLLAAISIPMLFVPALKPITWYTVPISESIVLPRLKLFTEEASHYSFLLAPVAIYFYSKALFYKTSNGLLTLFIITFPLALSFSLGVLCCLAGSFVVTLFVYFRRIFSKRNTRYGLLFAAGITAAVFVLLYVYYPANPVFLRIHNIFTGADTSARGRTYEAFILANKVIAEKSMWWGIGPGQLKLIGREIIVQYYYYYNIPKVIRIPNAAAETIVCFGYVGFCLRIAAEFVLFYTTKVYCSPYRVWLFLFVFAYQFTGSYITNVAEYLVWALVFSPVFSQGEQNRNGFTLKPAKR